MLFDWSHQTLTSRYVTFHRAFDRAYQQLHFDPSQQHVHGGQGRACPIRQWPARISGHRQLLGIEFQWLQFGDELVGIGEC